MAGHNKWSKVKRQKAVTDGRKGKVFSRLSREISIAAKAGGGDPEANMRLRTLVLKAREANMPVDNVTRAIQKGTGELPGVSYEDITYEAYGPGGVAFIVKVTTDNKNRAAADLRSFFTKHGGNLAGSGAVAFQFLHAGQLLIALDAVAEDRLLDLALQTFDLAAGADDVLTTADGYEVRCNVHAFDVVLHALEQAGIKTESAELAHIPATLVPVDTRTAQTLAALHELLESHDDVQQVFSNEELPD